jgi:hypothetical protein
MMTELEFWIAYVSILVTCLIGFIFGLYNCYAVLSIDTTYLPESLAQDIQNEPNTDKVEGQPDVEEKKLKKPIEQKRAVNKESIEKMNHTAKLIQSVINNLICRVQIHF